MAIIINEAQRAITERSVLSVTIWDQSGSKTQIAHQFTTLATQAEATQMVHEWLRPIKAANGYTVGQMMRYFPYLVDVVIKRTRSAKQAQREI